MLKSTSRPAGDFPESASTLPLGWSEHTAPTGHKYYYNAETKQSTYTYPAALPNVSSPQSPDDAALYPPNIRIPYLSTAIPASYRTPSTSDRPRSEFRFKHDQGNKDRPKRKRIILTCAPWVLVTTRLGRKFVHNPETGESLWKYPPDVMRGVVELDMQRNKDMRSLSSPTDPASTTEASQTDIVIDAQLASSTDGLDNVEYRDGNSLEAKNPSQGSSDDEYEEMEVAGSDADAEEPPDWQKVGAEPDEEMAAELGEDDMDFQLAHMEEQHSQDDAWTAEQSRVSFLSLLDDYDIDPFTTWDSVLDAGHVIEDERYTYVSTMKARREVFSDWSTAKIQHLKEQRSHQAIQNPRIPYLSFLQQHAAPKLFWTEFRRKFKTEPEIANTRMTDKEREKLYREHINRITKASETERKADLQQLLRSIVPSGSWNRAVTAHDNLPAQLLTDIRYISLPPGHRDQIVRDFLRTLPESGDVMSVEERDAAKTQRIEREKQLAALKDRQAQVDDAKRRQLRNMRSERTRMQHGDEELDRALSIGKGGLLEDLSGIPKDTTRRQ